MNRSFIRPAAFVAAALAVGISVFSPLPAKAGSFTFSDANCASFSLLPPNSAGNATSNYLLTCASLNCQITPAPSSSVLPGNPINLNTVCIPQPAGSPVYTWTLSPSSDQVNCPQNFTATESIQGLTATAATSPACTYTLTVTGASNGGGSATTTVSWTTVTDTLQNCALVNPVSTNPNPLGNAGGTATPAVTGCTTTPASLPLTYAWTISLNGGPATTWVGANSVSPTDTTSFANAITSGSVSATYVPTICIQGTSVCTTVSPGVTATQTFSGGGGPINCGPAFANTRVLRLDWNSTPPDQTVVGYSSSAGGFGKNDALVVVFTPPAGTASSNVGTVESGEYQSNTANVISKLSQTPCDFAGARNGGVSPTIYFTVGAPGNGLQINAGQPAYWNMEHDSSCTAAQCNIVVNLTKPQGE